MRSEGRRVDRRRRRRSRPAAPPLENTSTRRGDTTVIRSLCSRLDHGARTVKSPNPCGKAITRFAECLAPTFSGPRQQQYYCDAWVFRQEWSGCGIARRSRSWMFSKSWGLQVNSGRSVLIAVAAMSASYARAAGLRPARRRSVAIRPNARAAAAPKGSGSKSDSASCRWACLAARSSGSSVIKGPTESSAKVIALMTGSSGSNEESPNRPSRMTVEVSSRPRSLVLIASNRAQRPSPDGDVRGRPA